MNEGIYTAGNTLNAHCSITRSLKLLATEKLLQQAKSVALNAKRRRIECYLTWKKENGGGIKWSKTSNHSGELKVLPLPNTFTPRKLPNTCLKRKSKWEKLPTSKPLFLLHSLYLWLCWAAARNKNSDSQCNGTLVINSLAKMSEKFSQGLEGLK